VNADYDIEAIAKQTQEKYNKLFVPNVALSEIRELNGRISRQEKVELIHWQNKGNFCIYKLYWKGNEFYALFHYPSSTCYSVWSLDMHEKIWTINDYDKKIERFFIGTPSNKPLKLSRPQYRRIMRKPLYYDFPICALCKLHIEHLDESNIDHITPRAKGGTNSIDNLQLTHRICNKAKSNAHAEVIGQKEMRRYYLKKKYPDVTTLVLIQLKARSLNIRIRKKLEAELSKNKLSVVTRAAASLLFFVVSRIEMSSHIYK
jgi:5-methylcytosine-specific restriction endonuclease McrA